MAKRNMIETARKAIIPERYDMSARECVDLVEMARTGDTFEAISTAFKYGFVLGQRAATAPASQATEEQAHAQAAAIIAGIKKLTPAKIQEAKDYFSARPDLVNIISLAETVAGQI